MAVVIKCIRWHIKIQACTLKHSAHYYKPEGSLQNTKYVQRYSVSAIIHLCALNVAIGFYQRMNLKCITYKAREPSEREVTGREKR